MRFIKKSALLAGLLSVSVLLLTACGSAQQSNGSSRTANDTKFPTKEVKVWIPMGAGGTMDLAARAMGQKFQELTGQPLIVENVPGGSGVTGTTQFIKNAPDGYNIFLSASGQLNLRPLLQKVSYQFPKNFTPIIGVGSNEMVLAVKNDAPFKNFSDMVKYYKDKNQAIRVGNTGVNTDGYLAGAQIGQLTGLNVRLMPFNSNNEEMTNLLGGHIDLYIGNLATAYSSMKTGTVKIIGAANDKRYEDLPDVPTLKEQGTDVSGGSWFGFYGPANLPKDITEKLQDVLKKSMQSDQFVKFAKDNQLSINMTSPEEMTKALIDGGNEYAKLVKKK
ncbi:tripartite tricarboxylate transporter substrate binding protein [Desulfosporosinus sp. FKA]|uniref:tripartite tricarboxylate transporter substrate binding protein n=1 Tax=Desulfosporosinus sp. FKA TaxID=1969834 RepID=UPI000B497CB8|nr:tripartite tricarboxylate transporter substrate binding protein [Desulfosporosinus sp. FKA]